MGDERYDLFVTNLANDFYLSVVRVNGVDMMALGIEGRAASASRPIEMDLDPHDGRVSGRALGSDDSVWSRASVALIPDPPAGRVQSSGKYILMAWLDDAPCDYCDPDDLGKCRYGVEVQEAGVQNVELKMRLGAKG